MPKTPGRLTALICLSLLAAACGASDDGGTPPPPTPDVTVTPATAAVPRGATRAFTAAVSDSEDQTVIWKVNGVRGGEAVHGLISLEGVYIAPAAVPSPATVTITATSLTDAAKSGTATVTVQTGSPVSVVIAGSGARAFVPTFGSRQFTATVAGTANTAVTWSVNGTAGGSAATGTISPAGLYRAPRSVPVSTSVNYDARTTEVIVTAVSQADTTASDSVIVVPTPIQSSRFPAPVPLGTSGGNAEDQSTVGGTTYCCSGTIGSLVSRGGKTYILSNTHVLARSDLAALGESVIQPGLVDNNCSSLGAVLAANLSQFFHLENDPRPNVDAALAEVVPGAVDPLGAIVQLGAAVLGDQPTDGTPNPGLGTAPSVGRTVAKSGAATGLTCGTIVSIATTIYVEYQLGCNTGSTYVCDFTDQIVVADTGFSAHGDSGALIVAQDTADPVGLLFAGTATETVASPVAVVRQQLADKDTAEQFVFVGDGAAGPHPVAACSIAPPSPARVFATGDGAVPSAADRQAAAEAREARLQDLLGRPGVLALGLGRSHDHPGRAAVLIVVERGAPRGGVPAAIDGVPTRIIEADGAGPRGLLTAAESEALERAAFEPRIAVPVSETEEARARAVHRVRAAGLMDRRGVQAVGVSSSLDAPGEAALIVFVLKGAPRDAIPTVLDGLRTRVRETSRFRAR